MNITIRSETAADYTAIAEVVLSAFHEEKFVDEMVLVDTLRHLPGYDADLSLVAEADGRIAGHAMFTPHTVLVGGAEVGATNLAPLGVLKEYQGKGVGSALMTEGHRRAKEKGAAFDFLWGHPAYYPRFGYRTGMFGECSIVVKKNALPRCETNVEERQVTGADIPFLLSMWKDFFADAPFAIRPTGSLVDWTSHGENARTSVVLVDSAEAAYIRYRLDRPHAPAMFLARDADSAAAAAVLLASKTEEKELKLPLYPGAAAVAERIGFPCRAVRKVWDACMIKILDESNEAIAAYVESVATDGEKTGIPLLPPLFDALP